MEKRPKADIQELEREEKAKGHFAAGFGFYKLFWIFFIGCFLGVVIETIWCLITRGHYESRTGLIYGPLNLVYGFGARTYGEPLLAAEALGNLGADWQRSSGERD